MSGINNRRHERVKHRAKIRVYISPEQEVIYDMQDFSESGLYVKCDDTSVVSLGDIIEVQTLELEDAPVLPSKVVRIDKIGFAVEFAFD